MNEHLIEVSELRIHAYHGCLPEETIIGTEYIINVWLYVDFSEAALSDNLEHTVDYVRVSEIIHEQMAIPSKLIEQVGRRIADALWLLSPRIERINLEIRKNAPPVGKELRSVSIWIKESKTGR